MSCLAGITVVFGGDDGGDMGIPCHKPVCNQWIEARTTGECSVPASVTFLH